LKINCKWIYPHEFEQIIENFLDKYWPERILPVDMETIIEFRLDLNIESKIGLRSELDIDAYLTGDLTTIVIDEKYYIDEKYQNRSRFSLAHEVGHFVLHKNIYPYFKTKTPEEKKTKILDIPIEEYRKFEWQAYEFAGRLLVPKKRLIDEFEKFIRTEKYRQLSKELEVFPDIFLAVISDNINNIFGVSPDVISKRLKREKLWPIDYF